MKLKRITFDFADIELLNALAKEAFPPEEYIAPIELIEMSQKTNLDFWALYEDKSFIGFSVIVTHKTMVYLFFLAINPTVRSLGYGSIALSELIRKYPSYQHVVDMEMIDNNASNIAQRIKRKKFYLKNGYMETGHYLSYFGVSYEIMCKNKDFDFELFKELLKTIPIRNFNPIFFNK
ncbi:GNAT family N-acetyltransferase [uncultured Parabacteroides sp.]|uniref:GNAT family N-acetyltransferase n=2 Tax=uncultured Parabacteroides sp. TaxID=512312 RepID=UPI002659E099|nr:GNAT family N-acetyltransferase [uncultured Parabacteroides sp.]